MGQINRLSRGQAKPYASVPRIDWAHPLAKNLVSYNYDLGGQVIDLVTGGIGIETGGTGTLASRTQSKLGYGYKYAGTASCDGAEAALPTVKAANLITTAPYAVAVGMLPTGSPTASTSIISIMDPANNFGFQLNVPSTATQFEVKFAGSAATPEDYITAANTNSVGVFHTVIGNAATSTTGSVYVDGKQDGTFSGNTTTFTSSTYQLLYNHIFVGGNSGSGGINGFVYYVAQWNRTLTAAEASLLHGDPYCLLIYPEDEMFATLVGVTPSATIWVPQGDNNALIAATTRSKISAIALAAGAVWVPNAISNPPNSQPAGWYQPLSTPLPVAKAQLGSFFVPFNTPQVAVSAPWGWQSIPSAAPAIAKVPTTSTLTFVVPPFPVPKGWESRPLTAPPIGQAQQGSFFVPFNTLQITPTPSWGWYQSLSVAPAVAKVNAPNLPFITPPFVVPSGWQSTSALAPPIAAPQLGSFFVPFDTLQLNTTPFEWYQALATTPSAPPVQSGSAILSYNIAPIINTISGMGWFQILATTPLGPPSQIGATFVPFDTTQIATAVSPYGWYQPLSLAPLVAQAIYTQPIWVPAPFQTFTLAWQQPLSAALPVAIAPYTQPTWTPSPFTTFTLGWQQPLATTPLAPLIQLGSTSLSYAIQPLSNTVVGMPWQQPLSTPIPIAVVYQSPSFVPYDTAQIIVTTTLIQRTLTGVGL